MLAAAVHCLRGTPYIYQGEELGMTNAGFTDISQYRDVESLNHFQILQDKGLSAQNAYQILQIHSRDNSRTPMQWDDGCAAGFTSGTPWIEVNDNHHYINAKTEQQDQDSIFHFYRKLVKLRREYDVIAYGDFKPIAKEHSSVFAYKRTYGDEDLLVINNFYGKETVCNIGADAGAFQWLLGNYPARQMQGNEIMLRPYESMVLYKKI